MTQQVAAETAEMELQGARSTKYTRRADRRRGRQEMKTQARQYTRTLATRGKVLDVADLEEDDLAD